MGPTQPSPGDVPARILAGLAAALLVGLAVASCGGPTGDQGRGQLLYMQPTIAEGAAPGCVTCHSLDPGVVIVGPSHAGVARRAAEAVEAPDYNGEAQTASEYLRESILQPNAHVVEGFEPGVMYQKYAEVLTEQQVLDLVAFLLTLK